MRQWPKLICCDQRYLLEHYSSSKIITVMAFQHNYSPALYLGIYTHILPDIFHCA